MTQQQAGQHRLTPEEQETAVLLSLAYLGLLTLPQLARLLLTSERTIQRRLTQDDDSLAKRGLVARVDRAAGVDQRGVPTRGVAWWQLTDEGQRAIRSHAQYPSNHLGHNEQYPARPALVRKGRQEHDSLVAETVICLLEAARAQGQSVSGVFARLELKLNPFHSAPWADALVVYHTAVGQPGAHPIPWTRDLPTSAESDFAFVVELDRATEPLATLGGKAVEYKTMFEDYRWQRHWSERFGPSLPRILWVVPNAQRGAQVQRVWQEQWPEGRWYIATLDEMRNNAWQRSLGGERTTTPFFKQLAPAQATAIAPVTAVAAGSTRAPAATTSAASKQTMVVAPLRRDPPREFILKLRFTDPGHALLAMGARVELLDAMGNVIDAARILGGSAHLPTPVPEHPVRLRLPTWRIDLALDASRATLELRLPEPPPPRYPSRLWRFLGEVEPWGGTGFERALDQSYHACAAYANRVNEQTDAQMQEATRTGSMGSILAGGLAAFASILPLGLAFVGQCLCVLLRLTLRLARAVGWALGTAWDCAWNVPGSPVLQTLARLLLALTLLVWLPLASWNFYDGELRSWPCRLPRPDAAIYGYVEPSLDADPMTITSSDELRCLTRTVPEQGWRWRRITVNGHGAWVDDRMVQAASE